MTDKLIEVGRLAFREEGDYWNAYFADKDTMVGAILLGSIRMSVVLKYKLLKEQFMALMKQAFDEVAQEATGHKPSWKKPQTAPEHERTKS